MLPATVDDFLELVKKSGVLEQRRLDAYVESARRAATLPKEPAPLADAMIRDGLLTTFQARALLRGKWRGFRIGHFLVLERLGSGEMSNVFLCNHKDMRRRVAVKVLTHIKAADPTTLKRFYREARAAAVLQHPNIVHAHDVDQDQNLHYLVMDYVDGVSFQELVENHGPLDVPRAAHYIRQAAEALEHAHQAGLVHRDVKPSNLMLDRQGTVKLLDLGVARFHREDEDVLTQQGVLGSADFLAPEQAVDSHQVDRRADIYSLGATFYFLLTGSARSDVVQSVEQLLAAQRRGAAKTRPEVPRDVEAIIDKMMAKEPADRYQSAADVADALAPWTEQPIDPPLAEEMPRLSLAAQGKGPTAAELLQPPAPPAAGAAKLVVLPPPPAPVALRPSAPVVPQQPPTRSSERFWSAFFLVAVIAFTAATVGWLLFNFLYVR